MARPTKKDIKAAVEKLKAPQDGHADLPDTAGQTRALGAQKTSQRIRKKGV